MAGVIHDGQENSTTTLADDALGPDVSVELPFDWRDAVAPLIVAVITFLAFLPCLRNGFVDWDDDKLLLNNYEFRGLGPAQIRWMFTTAKMGHYQPLAWLTLGADYAIWGMNPRGYHLTSIMLHALGAVLVYFLALNLFRIAMMGAVGGEGCIRTAAVLAALFYAVHPLRVESVAWVTERRDLVCMLFLTPAVLCYLRYASGRGGPQSYAAAVALHGLSLLAKPWGMTLPLVLLVLDAYPLRRIQGRAGLLFRTSLRLASEKAPFAAMSALAALISLKAQAFATMESLDNHSMAKRIAQACYGLCFYCWKSILPVGLSPLYEIPLDFNSYSLRCLACAVTVVSITILLIALRRRWPSGLTAWIIYGLIVAPVLGLAQTGPQLVADRYSYVACLPWAMLSGGVVLAARLSIPARRAVVLGGMAVVLLLAAMTWRQCGFWRDSVSLWERCLAVEPESWNGHNNLGVQRFIKGDYASAIGHMERSLAINPRNELARINLASAYARLGRRDEAAKCYREAARTLTRGVEGMLNLANGLANLGCYDDAIPILKHVISLDAENTDAQFALGSMWEHLGRTRQAIAQYETTLNVVEAIRSREGPLGPRSAMLAQQATAICGKLADLYEQRGDAAKARSYFVRMQGG